MDEVIDALREVYPEISADATVRVGHRPGNGPGSCKRTTNGPQMEPFVEITFDLPTEEIPDAPA
jgi:hypothetical protein